MGSQPATLNANSPVLEGACLYQLRNFLSRPAGRHAVAGTELRLGRRGRLPAVELAALESIEAGDRERIPREIAGRDQATARARAGGSTAASEMFAMARSAAGSSPARASTRCVSIATPFAAAFSRVTSTATSSRSTAMTGAKPSFAAAIEITPEPQPTSSSCAGSVLLQQLEAEPRRGMRSGPECPARVDHDGGAPAAAAPTAGRPRGRRPDRPVELAPARLPSRPRSGERGLGERRPHPLGCRAVGGELDELAALDLLEALRRQVDEPGTQLLGRARPRRDGGADQWKALFSFSKKPW